MAKGSRPNVPAQVCASCGARVELRLMLTPHEAAERAGVSVDKIYEWRRIRGFPAIYENDRLLRVHTGLFDQWLASRSQGVA